MTSNHHDEALQANFLGISGRTRPDWDRGGSNQTVSQSDTTYIPAIDVAGSQAQSGLTVASSDHAERCQSEITIPTITPRLLSVDEPAEDSQAKFPPNSRQSGAFKSQQYNLPYGNGKIAVSIPYDEPSEPRKAKNTLASPSTRAMTTVNETHLSIPASLPSPEICPTLTNHYLCSHGPMEPCNPRHGFYRLEKGKGSNIVVLSVFATPSNEGPAQLSLGLMFGMGERSPFGWNHASKRYDAFIAATARLSQLQADNSFQACLTTGLVDDLTKEGDTVLFVRALNSLLIESNRRVFTLEHRDFELHARRSKVPPDMWAPPKIWSKVDVLEHISAPGYSLPFGRLRYLQDTRAGIQAGTAVSADLSGRAMMGLEDIGQAGTTVSANHSGRAMMGLEDNGDNGGRLSNEPSASYEEVSQFLAVLDWIVRHDSCLHQVWRQFVEDETSPGL